MKSVGGTGPSGAILMISSFSFGDLFLKLYPLARSCWWTFMLCSRSLHSQSRGQKLAFHRLHIPRSFRPTGGSLQSTQPIFRTRISPPSLLLLSSHLKSFPPLKLHMPSPSTPKPQADNCTEICYQDYGYVKFKNTQIRPLLARN